MAQEGFPGRKKAEEKIKILLYANTEGPQKNELIIIGSSWKPSAFKKNTGTQLGFDYHANKKAWMTAEFFTGWPKFFKLTLQRHQE